MRIHISLMFLGLLLGLMANAQENKKPNTLLAKNMEDGSVFLKWVCEKVYYEDGFNLYRKTNNSDWQKLNTSPLLWNDSEVSKIAETFTELEMFKGLFQKITVTEFQGNVASVFALQKAFSNNDFAKAIAVGYQDEGAISNSNYTYRLTAIENGQEIEMDQIQITAGNYEQLQPPQNIVIERKKRKINFNFKPNPERYFGIIVTRTSGSGQMDTITGKAVYPVQRDIDEDGKLLPWPKHLLVDHTIDKKEAYTYEFFAVDYFSEKSASSGVINADVIDFDPPQEAFGLDFKIDTQNVTITWLLVNDDDRSGINVYRYLDTKGDSVKLNNVPLQKEVLEFKDKVESIGTYYYKVGVFDASGNEIISAPTMVQVRDIIPPLPPTGLKTTTDTGKVNLTWKPSKESDLMGYVIFKVIDNGTNNEEEYTMVNAKPTKETLYTESMSKNVKNTFHYVVSAVDTSWNYSLKSEYSVAKLPDHLPPIKPFIKIVTEESKIIKVEWVPNKDEDLKGYNIYRKNLKDTVSSNEKLNSRLIKLEESIYEDKLFDPGTKYSYTMEAVDSAGNKSVLSNEFQINTSGKNKNENVKLGSFSAKKKRRGKVVSLKWVALPENQVEGFVVYRKMTNDKRFMPYSGQLTNTVFNDKTFEKGKTYQYQLRVYTIAGDIMRSEIKEIEIPAEK
ncbi:hypothetical protein N9D34_00085 [Salibacteraceae bacterium]|nr:hypothetical protein [Salibacteraceae bacterium]